MRNTCCSRNRDDRFIGSPPLAFTFGLGGHVLFPFRIGASTIQLETAPPDVLLPAIAKYRATICFTAPTAYRAMLAKLAEHDISSLRKCVSAGEALPKATFDAWHKATGMQILDGIGATEMMHIFIGSPESEIRAGATGRAVPGYEAKVIDDDGRECRPAPSAASRCAGRPAAAISRMRGRPKYVQDGWNVTGDTYLMDADGYFWYQARSDDMIISAGYNIAGPEVESALLTHPAVAECGVVGVADEERGQIVKAYVVLRAGPQRRCRDDPRAAGLREGRDRAVQVSARDRICRRAAEDADRQAAALRIAQDRRRAGRPKARVVIRDQHDGTDQSSARSPMPTDDDLPRALQPQGWPRPLGYANGMTAKGRVVVTGGVVGWDVMQNFPDTLRRAGAPDLLQHPEDSRRRRRRARSTSCGSPGTSPISTNTAPACKELGRAYRETIGSLLSRDGGGAGRGSGREGRQDRDRGDRGRAGVKYAVIPGDPGLGPGRPKTRGATPSLG